MAEDHATKSDIERILTRIDSFATQIDFLKTQVDSFKTQILERLDTVKLELIERDEIVETKLLKEFRKWAVSFESKFKANEALVVGFSERMTSLEERVSDLEHGN